MQSKYKYLIFSILPETFWLSQRNFKLELEFFIFFCLRLFGVPNRVISPSIYEPLPILFSPFKILKLNLKIQAPLHLDKELDF